MIYKRINHFKMTHCHHRRSHNHTRENDSNSTTKEKCKSSCDPIHDSISAIHTEKLHHFLVAATAAVVIVCFSFILFWRVSGREESKLWWRLKWKQNEYCVLQSKMLLKHNTFRFHKHRWKKINNKNLTRHYLWSVIIAPAT